MAKENFERKKVDTTVATVVIEDTTGELTFDLADLDTPDLSGLLLTLAGPSSTSVETATLGLAFDEEFTFNPAADRGAVSISYQLDVLPLTLGGTSELQVAFALRQDQHFFLAQTAHVLGPSESWATLTGGELTALDFSPVDPASVGPDFSRSFEFGYAFTAEYSTEGVLVEVGVGSMQVEILTVPEPSSLLLAASMGASLLWYRWWRGG